ncbi:hypothetical protein INR49_015109, partial [Caranx melampygus]
YRGGSGPLHVSRGKTNHRLHKAFIEAGQQAGEEMEHSQCLSETCPGSSQLEDRGALPDHQDPVDGTRAVGVEYIQKGLKKRVFADKEVILSGGASIPLSFSCCVGSNLQDHLELYVQQQCTEPITLYKAQKPFHMVMEQQPTWRVEVLSVVVHKSHPDIQFHFLPSQVIDHGRVASKIEAYQVHVGPMRSTSTGWLKLKSTNPLDHPTIQPNYLSTDIDVGEFRECVKLSREIFAQEAFNPFRGPEVQPGPQVQSDADIDAFVRRKADSAYHPSCTCKMGSPSDPMAVVDSNTCVLGLEHLRVVDASIMPSIVSGNLNSPTIMMAEKAADIIRGRQPLVDPGVPVALEQRSEL